MLVSYGSDHLQTHGSLASSCKCAELRPVSSKNLLALAGFRRNGAAGSAAKHHAPGFAVGVLLLFVFADSDCGGYKYSRECR